SGFLLDGTKFDSSVERDEPFTFVAGVGQVIPGWDEGVQLMKKGSKARLIVPSNLAYGDRDLGKIPPNSTLIFDVEVLDVK
ncbi:MAG TPA: FKBP-type peptidyl-prolyl cis-trans isomerase, partial [Ignavibacteriaceae bacterium]|nr:FKBP-type peptidyl-prolyl cis-trans isomerase [Ignavibacteriaceae bacterium]